MTRPFNNPYSGLKDVKRITTDVSSGDYYLVKSMRPELATITATLGTLWQKLCYELRKRNITDVTRVSDFEQFVATCRITDEPSSGSGGGLSSGSTGGPHGTTPTSNVGGGTTQSGPSDSSATAVVPNLQSGGRKGRKGQAKGSGTE